MAYQNSDFYDADGNFDAEAGKRAYLEFMEEAGYPLSDNVRQNLWVTDYSLGKFLELGLACIFWVNDEKAGYASLDVVLLPGQIIPEHWHEAVEGVPAKMESWNVRYGSTHAFGEGEPTAAISVTIPECERPYLTVMNETRIGVGEVTGLKHPLERHWQKAGPEGCIMTESATYHSGEALRFANPNVKF